jgi:hypothetical protein
MDMPLICVQDKKAFLRCSKGEFLIKPCLGNRGVRKRLAERKKGGEMLKRDKQEAAIAKYFRRNP